MTRDEIIRMAREAGLSITTGGCAEAALDPASTAAILLREHDNVEQSIAYAERMAQRYADSRNMMALDYQNAAKELKEWKRNKPRCTTN